MKAADPKTLPMHLQPVASTAAPPFRELLQQPAGTHGAPTVVRAAAGVPAQGRPTTAPGGDVSGVTVVPGRAAQSQSAATTTAIGRVALKATSTAEGATPARGRVEAEALRLQDVRGALRTEALGHTEQQHDEGAAIARRARLVEQLTRELVAAFEDGGTSAANDPPDQALATTPTSVLPASAPSDAAGGRSPRTDRVEPRRLESERAAQAVALIERIELFVKEAQRPALGLTLNNSLGARVEIERLGPGEVAIKLIGHRGPPAAETVARLRDELRDRGLKVAAMSVA